MNGLISLTFPLIAQYSHALPFGFFAAMMVVQFMVVRAYFPETMGVSLEELQHRLETAPVAEPALVRDKPPEAIFR